jgi:Tfp pilus assembly protein PilX
MKTISTNKQSGAVSLFVVIFFMLLATVVTVSFVRLMLTDQQQASDNDLSQSAYDSAQAGVEDAKRALLQYKSECLLTTTGSCATYSDRISSDVCNSALVGVAGTGLGGASSGPFKEVMIQQSSGGTTSDDKLNQAYTCVTIDLATDDFVGTIQANQSQLVPLKSAGAFNRVKVEWFNKEDISAAGGSSSLNLSGIASNGNPLYAQGQWPLNRPSLLRSQLIQVANTGFTLPSFDVVSDSRTNGATMFLYPTSQSGISEVNITQDDARRTDPADDPDPKTYALTPTSASCKPDLSSGGYACSSVLVLPQPIGAGDDANRVAFMRLTPLYNATHYRVTLFNNPVSDSSTPVQFKDVQPMVDSTGRANDLFRRVQSRVDLFDTTFPYPEAAVDVTGSFCKDFAVTANQYIAGTSGCNP